MKLFEEFPPVTTEAWMEVVLKDLKGADFDKKLVSQTLDGLALRPFYRSEDLPPTLGGDRSSVADWALREEVRQADPAEANSHALRALERGAEELAIYVYPIGPNVLEPGAMQTVLAGIDLTKTPIHWLAGPLAEKVYDAWRAEASRQGVAAEALTGSVDLDPILDRCAGFSTATVDDWQTTTLPFTERVAKETPGVQLFTVRGAFIEKAGASLAQELAFTLAIYSEYLAASRDRLPLERVVRMSELRFGVGTNYLLEIAKMRAARILVRNLLAAYGVDNVRPKLHAITTSSNKTLYDPHNNLLRATIEGMAAVLGGIDSLSIAAYNQGYQTPDEFGEHLARNTETLLKEEAYLSKVADPLGGSYTVEAITHSLAEAAWTLFRSIEESGGFVAAWKEGFIGRELDRIRAQRNKQVSQRRRTIVGTTVYPNLKERRLADVEARPRVMRVRPDGTRSDEPVPSTALDPFRPSWPMEHLRLRTERFEAAGGKRPVILLAKTGSVAMRQARAAFCLSFLGAGGYDVREETFATAADIPAGAAAIGADLIVLCSSDPEYLEIAKAVPGPKVVAGLPAEGIEELKAAGVTDFVHLRLDQQEALTQHHAQFGIPEIPLDAPLNPSKT